MAETFQAGVGVVRCAHLQDYVKLVVVEAFQRQRRAQRMRSSYRTDFPVGVDARCGDHRWCAVRVGQRGGADFPVGVDSAATQQHRRPFAATAQRCGHAGTGVVVAARGSRAAVASRAVQAATPDRSAVMSATASVESRLAAARAAGGGRCAYATPAAANMLLSLLAADTERWAQRPRGVHAPRASSSRERDTPNAAAVSVNVICAAVRSTRVASVSRRRGPGLICDAGVPVTTRDGSDRGGLCPTSTPARSFVRRCMLRQRRQRLLSLNSWPQHR